jgi:hypothetical protein
MELKVTSTGWMEAVHAGIIENVRAVATLGAEAEIVDMRRSAVLEDRNQLVPGAVKAALTSIVLVPDQQVLPFRVERPRGGEQFRQMPPIHEDVMD